MFDYILNNCAWLPDGSLVCDSVEDASNVRRFLRELILDSHLYVNKAVGFKIRTAGRAESGGVKIARYNAIGESYIELMNNLSNKVILDPSVQHIRVELHTGINTVDSCIFKSDDNREIKVLYEDPYICRVLDDKKHTLTLDMKVSSGYLDMHSASKFTDGFPAYVYYNIGNFVRVRPSINSTFVTLNYYNGFNPELFKKLLEINMGRYQSAIARGEDRAWKRNFEH